MGYKLLGFVVWRGGKWYMRHRVSDLRMKLTMAVLGTFVVGAVIVERRHQNS